ncbi:MAG: homoserine kinase, partial [Leptolyngbyaceae cyanobacterium MO_188.B28]|nr:homoserine kinase [Leptolyngbyaceae cyanobacterium MO_188.B28]
SGSNTDWIIGDVPWHEAVIPIVVIPNFELSTAEARKVLPQSYSRADAIFNTSHLGLLLRGLATGRGDWLKAALVDRIHQPYRQTLIPGYEAVAAAAIQAGAHGVVISGAGPTLLALANQERADAIADAMAATWAESGVEARAMALSIDFRGAVGAIDKEVHSSLNPKS